MSARSFDSLVHPVMLEVNANYITLHVSDTLSCQDTEASLILCPVILPLQTQSLIFN